MTVQRKVIYSTTARWRDAGAISCFTWPSNEVTHATLTSEQIVNERTLDNELPGWRHRIAKGLSATTAMIALEDTLEYTPGHVFLGKWCNTAKRFGYFQMDGDLFSGHTSVWNKPSAASQVLPPTTDAEALVRAIKDARSKQSHFRGGNFLAELNDTIRGLRNPAKGFRDLLDVYRRNARKRVKRATGRRPVPTTRKQFEELQKNSPDVSRAAQRALSDSWLEANFGWTPLLNDAVDAYHALRALSARVPLVRFFGQSTRMGTPSYTSNFRLMDITSMRFTVRTVSTFSVRYYGAVKVEVDAPPSGQAVEEMGVRARDFVPAVWEAIPYSFLIDYFSNIGDIIEVASFPRSDIAWIARTFQNHSTRSTEQVAIEETSGSYPNNNSNKTFSFTPASVKWDLKYVNRTAFSGSFVPSLRFEIPGSKNWRKWANIAALARLRTL